MWKSCHCLKDMVEQVSQKLSLGRSFGLFLELSNNEQPVWLFVIMMIRFYFQNTEQTLDWNLWAYCIWFHIVMSFFHLAIRYKKNPKSFKTTDPFRGFHNRKSSIVSSSSVKVFSIYSSHQNWIRKKHTIPKSVFFFP